MLARLPAVLLALATLAGCVTLPGGTLTVLSDGSARVVDEAGQPVPYAAATFLLGELVVARLSAAADGTLPPVSSTFDAAVVSAPGFEARTLHPRELSGDVALRAQDGLSAEDASPLLRLLPPHTFERYVFGPEPLCGVRNSCGLSEPVIEAAAGGVLYASSVCCIGGSPPVWVSRDAGATWEHLRTPGVREAVGIEGDIAIDAAGNVYFTDILLGAMWITSWDAEGNWRHSTLVPFEPLVDRPWVRAGAEDVVYFLYNTGRVTNFHVSTDGGRTFLPVPARVFPAPLGTLAQGTDLEHLVVVAGGTLYESTDGGATWSDGEKVPTPKAGGSSSYGFWVPAIDAAGRVLVAYDRGSTERGYGVFAAIRELDGTWRVREVSPPNGTHVHVWPEAGPAGGFALAWYGVDLEATNPDAVAEDAPWHVYLATTHDAGETWQLARADPEPVLHGPMARRLLDFLQVDLDERGAAHLVYAHNRDGTRAEMTSYTRSTVGLGLPQLAPDAGAPSGRNALHLYGSAALDLA